MKKNLLIGVTGSVASVLTPKLCTELSKDFNIMVVATNSSLAFFDSKTINDMAIPVFKDSDEWNFGADGYQKGDKILHIHLRNWADVLLIAPLSANSLAKMANGLCDNLLTSIVRAWDVAKPMFVAPSMNTKMWESPFTDRHLTVLEEIYNTTTILPIEKKLACGEQGIGAMENISVISNHLREELKWTCPIYNCQGIPINNHPGSFGYKRSYYYHTGVDLYVRSFCNGVFAVESGVVVGKELFTGPALGHKQWD